MIQLRAVTKENIDDVLALKVGKDQERYVSSNSESLAQAYVYSKTAYPFVIYHDETIVGFIMMAYYEKNGYYTLWKFMVDERYQDHGYGREALMQGIDFIKNKFGAKDIYTGVIPDNKVAKGLYESVGFVFTGVYEDGMEELRLQLEDR